LNGQAISRSLRVCPNRKSPVATIDHSSELRGFRALALQSKSLPVSTLMTGSSPRRLFLQQLGLVTAGMLARRARVGAQASGSPLFRSDVELVSTPVTVVDGDGRLVATLNRDDFEIFEDGVPRPIAHFTRERVPVSVALVLDASDSMVGARMADARAALTRFLDDLLAPDDELALVAFNHRPRVTVSWTEKRAKIRDPLNEIRPSGGTALYDAVGASLPLFRSRNHQRGAMVLVSDGADTASDASLAELAAILTGSDVFIYAIGIQAANGRRSTEVNPWALRDVTGRSGGYTEIVSQPVDLGPATARIADELNHQYMLAFSPDRRTDGRYHTIRVAVKGQSYRVRSRRGYFAGRGRS
jgi:Ca-activated chloride channel family protein